MPKMSMKQAAKAALECQDACNLSGVAFTFADAMYAICGEAWDKKHGTEWKNSHPIVTMFLDKLTDLNGWVAASCHPDVKEQVQDLFLSLPPDVEPPEPPPPTLLDLRAQYAHAQAEAERLAQAVWDKLEPTDHETTSVIDSLVDQGRDIGGAELLADDIHARVTELESMRQMYVDDHTRTGVCDCCDQRTDDLNDDGVCLDCVRHGRGV